MNRQELLQFVYRPALEAVKFDPEGSSTTDMLPALQLIVQEHDLHDLHETLPSLKMAHERRETRKKTHLRKFLDKAEHIQSELGSWASDYFIRESIDTFKVTMREGGEKLCGWRNVEKDSIMKSLCHTRVSRSLSSHTEELFPRPSAKFKCLVSVLRRVYNPGFCGIVFVNQRASAIALSQLLMAHPETGTLFRCGTFVGMSSNVRQKTKLGDLLNPRVQQTTLDETNEPPNLKAFIQRRGRARKEKSNFFVLLASDSNAAGVQMWRELEREMTEAYQRDRKIANEASTRENVREEGYGNFLVESTG